jgi:hypothetical protein
MEGSMKKLFVLFLCLVAVAGFVSAGTVHPPGVLAPETLPEYGVDCYAITPDTVLVVVTPTYGLPDQILVVSDMIASEMPQINFMIAVIDPDGMLSDILAAVVDYPLRL